MTAACIMLQPKHALAIHMRKSKVGAVKDRGAAGLVL